VIWIGVVVGALVVGAAVTVVAGRAGALSPPVSSRRDVLVPADRDLTAADLRAVRFTRAWRGYARDEVDALLARLEADAAAREATVAPAASPEPADPPTSPDAGEQREPDEPRE